MSKRLTEKLKTKIRESIFVVHPWANLWDGEELDELIALTIHKGLSMLIAGEQVKSYKGKVTGLTYTVSFTKLEDVKGCWESDDFVEAVVCAACMALKILPEELKPKKVEERQTDCTENDWNITTPDHGRFYRYINYEDENESS